jgi:hypothetical protein
VARLHGRDGQIRIGNGSPYTVIGSLSGWNLSFTRDKVETTSFGDTNKTYLAGLQDVSGTFEGFFDTTYIRALFDAADDSDGTNIRITPNTTVTGYYFTGPCWLDLSISGSVNDAVKVSGTISANGSWTLQVDGSPVD